MHKNFEINRTKIKGSCQSGRKLVPHDSKSDLPLARMRDNLTDFRVSGQSQVHFLGRGLGQTEHDLLDLDGVMRVKGSPVGGVEWCLGHKIPTLKEANAGLAHFYHSAVHS